VLFEVPHLEDFELCLLVVVGPLYFCIDAHSFSAWLPKTLFNKGQSFTKFYQVEQCGALCVSTTFGIVHHRAVLLLELLYFWHSWEPHHTLSLNEEEGKVPF
jgi:hypothetical protein